MNWVQRIVIASCAGLTACGEPALTTLSIDSVENLDCTADACQHVVQVKMINWKQDTVDHSVKVEWAVGSIQALGEVPFTGNTTYLVPVTTTAVPDMPCDITTDVVASILNTATQTTVIDYVFDEVEILCNGSDTGL